MTRFSEKTALVTGASRGIGQAIAVQLASEGADVAICARSAERLEETAAMIADLGRKVFVSEVDMAQPETVVAVVKSVKESFGHIDVLVNNAGITKDGLLLRMGDADWDVVLDTNLKGVFVFTREVVRHMAKQRYGAIVNVSSVIGITGNAGQCNYAASKAGLIGFTKSVAREMGKRNIRVNAVAPGFIMTQMTDVLSDALRDKMMETIPLQRLGSPKDVADAVAYLASDEASYITGQVLNICGGMVTG
ncbi:MAG: 3-oxoacyl-[acyl-carrier-protein] reductase [Spartobacteria bacterium]|nr:3-oxoacyl-[acyl-carrier-protein] reductase [Spartobacteria bacterium]